MSGFPGAGFCLRSRYDCEACGCLAWPSACWIVSHSDGTSDAGDQKFLAETHPLRHPQNSTVTSRTGSPGYVSASSGISRVGVLESAPALLNRNFRNSVG